MTWFVFSLISIFSLAAAELSLQHILNLKDAFSARTVAFMGFLLQSIFIFPFIYFMQRDGFLSIFTWNVFPWVFASCLINSIATIFYTKSLQVKNISFSTIFASLSVVVSTSLGIYLFNESTELIKYVGIAAVIIAIIIANFRNAALEKNHLYGLVAGILFGLTFVLNKGVIQSIDPAVYVFWLFLFTAFFCFISNPKEVVASLKQGSFPAFKVMVLAALGYLSYNLFTFVAYKMGGEVGRVDAINNSEIFLIILFEYFILKHKGSIARKLIAAAIAFIGVYILGMY